ncbi:FAD/NAD(P)-binding domain-containing protein [Peniophora sp. CONT]|nr:FAD/NAD(P)-binding domain-containing protein [Peniophora sp. CONT]
MADIITAPRLRLAICGGGIGGLTLALALSRKQDIAIDVYESNSAFAELGAGIALRPRTLRYLAELGLLHEINSINGRLEEREQTGPALSYFRADKPDTEVRSDYYEKGMAMLHRAQFHRVLLRHIPKHVGIHTAKRLTQYLDPNDANVPIRLVFADGTEATCDVLIGADGFSSTVRATLFDDLASAGKNADATKRIRDCIPPYFSGFMSYRTVIPREKLEALPADFTGWNLGKIYVGDDMFVVTYPIAQGRLLNLVVNTLDLSREGGTHAHPWASVAGVKELEPLLERAAPEPRNILLAAEGLELKKWVVNVVQPLEEWSFGRVALLGDAAHAMVPFQGAGAGQAIEDAQVLSALLGHPRATCATVQHVFGIYADIRKPIAAKFYHASRQNGLIFSNSNLTLEECATEIKDLAEDTWNTGRRPEENAQRAVELFEAVVTETL